MHDRVDPTQRVAERGRVGQVAERDLDAHALVAEAALVAHQGAHGLAVRGEAAQQRGADRAGGARQKDHGRGAYGSDGARIARERRASEWNASCERPPAVSTRLRPARFASSSAASAARKSAS